MKNFMFFALIVLIVFFFLSSCIVAVVDYSEGSAALLTDEFHEVVPLDSGGTLALENINGDIEIQGWEREEVEIYAEKKIPRPYGRKVRWYSMGYPTPKIDIDEFNDIIKIKTRPLKKYKEASVVDFYLSVPQSVKLKNIIAKAGDISISDFYGEVSIELIEGDIDIDNFSGSLAVSVGNGSVKATLYDLRSEDEIEITTKQGDIVIYLQDEVKAQIKASTPNGDIFSEFDFKESLPASKISERIGENGARISLTSLNGDIRIKKF